ncbi:hypothetical protein [Nocardia sputorum]|uniref:Uncharacterized protein n=1 Tax=Nocardia sputorum TaxID=2984338 RepID=A0ABM8CY76_9NOCA|nr:hypothetical protein [Nocardia sputorum]BDT99971.1 hypothetical protein IFM12276_30000 [Nocardia sputorum]
MNDTWYEIYLPSSDLDTTDGPLTGTRPLSNDNTPLSIAVAPADPEPVPFGSRSALALDLFLHGSAGSVDEDLQHYLDDLRERRQHPIEFDSRGFARIGSIRLIVSPRAERDPDYACLSFSATNWSMALMFYRSDNLRDMFVGLTEAFGGVCCAWSIAGIDAIQVCWLAGQLLDPPIAVPEGGPPVVRTLLASVRRDEPR